MLTDPGDVVVDPFAGSCVTGAVSEALGRRWVACEMSEEYLEGALARFTPTVQPLMSEKNVVYEISPPCSMPTDPDYRLQADGGETRPPETGPKPVVLVPTVINYNTLQDDRPEAARWPRLIGAKHFNKNEADEDAPSLSRLAQGARDPRLIPPKSARCGISSGNGGGVSPSIPWLMTDRLCPIKRLREAPSA